MRTARPTSRGPSRKRAAKGNLLTTNFKEDLRMRLNQTYPLTEMLDALTAASDNTRELAEQLKAEGRHMQVFTVFEAENMLSVSPHARVTLTRRESENRWTGYMETSAYADGEKIPVAVNRSEYTLVANDDFTKFEIIM